MRTVVFVALVTLAALVTPWRSASAQSVNACGCYRDDAGACRCTKRNKCGCPEECEPVGCEAKREREAAREAQVALKQIAARERKKAAEAAALAKASKQKARDAEREAALAAQTAARVREAEDAAIRAAHHQEVKSAGAEEVDVLLHTGKPSVKKARRTER